jgi:hypothetical protein
MNGKVGSARGVSRISEYCRRFRVTQSDATLTMLAAAAGDIDESKFAVWMRDHAQRR